MIPAEFLDEADRGWLHELAPEGACTVEPADDIRFVPPPLPAPYLADDLPGLDDELLAKMVDVWLPEADHHRAQAQIYTLAADIRFRRERYEREHNVKIIEERSSF